MPKLKRNIEIVVNLNGTRYEFKVEDGKLFIFDEIVKDLEIKERKFWKRIFSLALTEMKKAFQDSISFELFEENKK